MEKAKLIIKESKRKKLVAELHFEESNKVYKFNQFKPKDCTLNGKVVEVKREKGHPVEVVDGETIIWTATVLAGKSIDYSKEKRNWKPNAKNKNTVPIQTANAPYNFVPLNEQVVLCEHAEGKPPSFDVYHRHLNSGYLELKITTKTPLYIRDTMTADDMKAEAQVAKENKKNNTKYKYINSDFFSPGGNLRIPGSSLRGMLRTMVEIAGFSKLSFYEKDRKYHFRSFADKSIDLRDEYSKKMKGDDEKSSYSKELKAGYLVKEGLKFRIIPAKRINNRQFFRVDEELTKTAKIIYHGMSFKSNGNKYNENKKYSMGFKDIKFFAPSGDVEDITQIFRRETAAKDALEGKLVCSGWMRGSLLTNNPQGKHKHWVVGPADNKILDLEDGVIENYKNDEGRHEQADLLKYFNKNPRESVPCFYVEKDGKVISFGHTGFFRLAYAQKLSNLIPGEMKNSGIVDISESIFGNESIFPGRVFFEDAYLDQNQENVTSEETIIKILGRPSPKTFQHYLEQDKKDIWPERQNYHGIKNFNTPGSRLRGYKLYWHKSDNPVNWKEEKILFHESDFKELLHDADLNEKDFGSSLEKPKGKKYIVHLKNLTPNVKQIVLKAIGRYETQHTKIKYVNTDKAFYGKIRFENLTDVELGALLFVLQLPEGCFHKLGMGKPLGLGSIQISTKLYFSNRQARYKSLFSEWENPLELVAGEKLKELKNEFAKYILSVIEPDESHDINRCGDKLWQIDRMRQFKLMIDFNNRPSDEDTGYMELEDFKKRKVLPLPENICNP